MEIKQILAQMAPPELAPARQETRPSKITDDAARLDLAISRPKVRDLPEEEFKQCLRYIYALIGLRAINFPVGEEKEFLHGYIRQHYGGHSADEIRLAFDMAVQGKLQVDPVCYENFSAAYFARIMNVFRSWAREQVQVLQKVETPRELTPAEKLQLDIDYAFYLFKQINKLPVKL